MSVRLRFHIHGLNRKLNRAAHVMGPTLIALALAGATNVAHAQGTMDFSGATTLMQTLNLRNLRGRCHLFRRPDLCRNQDDERSVSGCDSGTRRCAVRCWSPWMGRGLDRN